MNLRQSWPRDFLRFFPFVAASFCLKQVSNVGDPLLSSFWLSRIVLGGKGENYLLKVDYTSS